jgi:hypothetical protein
MKKQWFTAVFCGVLLVLVGILWWRVRELEKSVNSLRVQPASNSTVVWQNEQKSKNDSEKKQVFKLIDSTPVDPGKSKVGVPWTVERAMIPDGNQGAAPRSTEGEWRSEAKPLPEVNLQDLRLTPKQSESK